MNDATFEAYEAKYEAAQRLEAEILPRNKAVLFDALSAAGVATVVIEFEGSELFGRTTDEVTADLRRALRKQERG